ncbi:hypothetical protein ZBT109_0793 [Zymobacter palmae]|uniref:Uncharacterized protein n=1 Tax=Zymobacter palmae TaxID=33074 RepID=A0A348HD67_9GAMM|nr:hypothetical protein ZBT109_0793 [Zymobacter palmae]
MPCHKDHLTGHFPSHAVLEASHADTHHLPQPDRYPAGHRPH